MFLSPNPLSRCGAGTRACRVPTPGDAWRSPHQRTLSRQSLRGPQRLSTLELAAPSLISALGESPRNPAHVDAWPSRHTLLLLLLPLLAVSLEARSLFLLGSVQLAFDKNKSVHAELLYQGSGQMSGRWLVTRPGDPQPEEIARIDTFLPPSGKISLAGPEWARLPQDTPGAYTVRLEIERIVDRQGPAEIRMAAALPILRYWVGPETAMALTAPEDGAALPPNTAELRFVTGARALYRLEITDTLEHPILRVLLPAGASSYQLPSWLGEKLGNSRAMNWRLTALTDAGEVESTTTWWSLVLSGPN
jgi:hypothetical protein